MVLFWSRQHKQSEPLINLIDDHAGFRECPYHNGRMCVESIERLEDLKNKARPLPFIINVLHIELIRCALRVERTLSF